MQRKILFFALLSTVALTAAMPPMDMGDNHKIGVQNAILAKVNGTTISMMDVKKKMDFIFHQNYPHLVQSSQARFQYYEASWRHVLMEMIDNELILADAADKEIKLTDGEVREEIENRFGPNVMSTLDKIGITYDEAWKMTKNEMIVRRMTWWFIQAKALSQITPEQIRQGYRHHLQENPSYSELKYRVLTLRGDKLNAISEEFYQWLQTQKLPPEELAQALKDFETAHPGVTVALSNEFTAKDIEVSDSHKAVLSQLDADQYSKPVIQVSRDKSEVCRLFYLSQKTDHPAPSFEEVSPIIKNELLQKASGQISSNYIEKLRKHYRFDSDHLKETVPEDFQPFALQ